jgi:hypothetical protein
MSIRTRAAVIAIAATGALGLGVLGAGSALAGTAKVTAVTHTSDHPDTTSVSGPCTGTSGNGPTWAYDNLSRRFTVTSESAPGNYSVTITDNGSFSAFADPRTGDCYTGHGSIRGTIQFDVLSSTAPDPAALPAQMPGDVSTSATLSKLFDGNAAIVGGGHYTYTYTRVNGSVYVQSG